VSDNRGVRRSLLALFVVLAVSACAYTPAAIPDRPVQRAQSSRIYAADGTLIATLHAEENREDVPLAELPRHVRDAVLAIEDARFWEHRGVDAKAVLRAARANTAEGAVIEGGSTITQQYVKNALLTTDRTIDRKVEEALLAVQLERRYTKERILELYLNTIYLGNGAYGIQAAANEYFGVPASDLDLVQAATLAALIRAPSTTDPYDRPDVAVGRRNLVLTRMAELGWLDEEAAALARLAPLELVVPDQDERYPAPHFVERVKRFVLDDPRFGETPAERRALLFGGGLRIQTTIDLDLQTKAEEAVGRVISSPERDPDAALITIDPATGFVRALVGGQDFFGGGAQAKIDLATGGNGRPAGSSFKPLVLAAALEKGIPLDKVYDAPGRMDIPLTDEVWRVSNYEGGGGGRADLWESTVRSYNTVYAQLILEVGPSDAMAMANRLGVASPLQPFPSAVLGTNLVHPLDMAASYATFANRGLRVDPAFVTKISGPDGRVLYQHRHLQRRVLDVSVADQVTQVLQTALENGTGVQARIGRPAAGKTGTGQQWRDAWFVGYTPDLVTAVWMGFAEEGQRSMVPPTTRIRVTGGSWPAQVWQLYMSAALAEVPVTPFPDPEPPEEPAEDDELDPALAALPVLRTVVGMPTGPASEALTRDGYVVERREVPSDEYPPGYVAAQVPPPGTRLAGGSVVVLEIANGQRASASVPDVLGLDRETATTRLGSHGFTAVVVTEQEPTEGDGLSRAGLVWKQAPAGGSERARGAEVTIWVNPTST
jgi:penicillin-binding protein 1A